MPQHVPADMSAEKAKAWLPDLLIREAELRQTLAATVANRERCQQALGVDAATEPIFPGQLV